MQAAPNPLFTLTPFPPSSSNRFICIKVARSRGQKGKEEPQPAAPTTSLPAGPAEPSGPPCPLLHPGPLPVAPGAPRAQPRSAQPPTQLAAAPRGLRLAAEPPGDNFDGHNDAGGNHFNEDQSSARAAPHLLPRLRPTLPTSAAQGPPAARRAGGEARGPREDPSARRRMPGSNPALELPQRPGDPGNLGAGPASRSQRQRRPPARAPSVPPSDTPSTSGC